MGKCVCPWGGVLSKPEAQRRKENHRQARPPPTQQEKTPQRAGQGNFGHGADLPEHPFRKLLQAAAAGYQWLYRGRMLALLNPKSEAPLSPNAILGQNSLFCIRFLTVRSACAQPAHNLSLEPFSQTSSQASFQGQGGRGVHGRKSLVLLNLKSEAPLSPNAILVQNRYFAYGFLRSEAPARSQRITYHPSFSIKPASQASL